MGKRGKRNLEKEKFQNLRGRQKWQYVWDYYKLPLILLGILLYAVCYLIYGRVTRREPVLYTALVNVSAGEALEEKLCGGFPDFLSDSGYDMPSRPECHLYTGLYLTEDPANETHAYSYASEAKILGAIRAGKLDVVLMNGEALDIFSKNGYLLDLKDLMPKASQSLNDTLRAQLVQSSTAIDISQCPLFRDAGFQDAIYFGVIGNSTRNETAIRYLEYLYSIESVR